LAAYRFDDQIGLAEEGNYAPRGRQRFRQRSLLPEKTPGMWVLELRRQVQALKVHRANTLAKGARRCIENSNSGIEPLIRAPTIVLGLDEMLNVVLSVK
jgi:hypothetical protein